MAVSITSPDVKPPVLLGADGSPLRRTSYAAQDSAYRAASLTDPALRKFRPQRGSADSDLLPEKDIIDDRSRDIVRNEPIAKSGINVLSEMVLGTGVTFQPRPDYKALGMTKDEADEWASRASGLIHDHLDSRFIDATGHGNLHDLARLTFRTRLITGELAMVPVYLPDRPGATLGTAFLAIDPDRISNPMGEMDTVNRRAGVYIDEYGGAIGYSVRKAHEQDAMFGFDPKMYEWENIPAFDEYGRPRFILAFEKERPGQHRGISLMSAVMAKFKVASEYESAELQAALANAVVAAFTESTMDMGQLLDLFGGDAGAMLKERAEYITKIQNGAVLPLFPGDSFASHAPARPNTAFPAFMTSLEKRIASGGFDLPRNFLMRDFDQGSYVSIKMAFNSAWRSVKNYREWVKQHFYQVVYEMALEEAVGRGLIEADSFYEKRRAWCRCDMIFDGAGWLDPVREAQASQLRIATGISTLQDECAEQGKDWEKVLEQRAAEQKRMRELNLDLATIQNTVSIAPQIPIEPVDQNGDTQDQQAFRGN